MVNATVNLLNEWKDGTQIDIHRDMMRLTLDIVTQSLFNVDVAGPEAKTIAHGLELSMDWFSLQQRQGFLIPPVIPMPATLKYRAGVKEMDKFILNLIRERRSGQVDQGDLLSMFLQVRDENDGSPMSDRQLRDELITLILAGHETTANALTWTWMLLAQHPKVEQQLWAELDQVLGGRSPAMEDISKLPYTQWVLKESMRLYPPVVLLARSLTQDYDLDGYLIPKNTTTLCSPWVVHRSDRTFSDPLAFNPERWRENFEKQLPKCAYFPFGEGPRICIGKGFAQMEAILILATLAQKYQVIVIPDQTIALLPSIALRPKYGLQVQLVHR